MPTYREVYLEKDGPPAQPSLEELLQRESEDEDALSWADLTTSSGYDDCHLAGDECRLRGSRVPREDVPCDLVDGDAAEQS
jgi:hypothetical protein